MHIGGADIVQQNTMITSKEIARSADRIFAATVPPNVAIRSQQDQEDCGIDYELELKAENDQGTGFIFKIQQKGAEGISFNDGQTISYSDLLVERVGYYLNQLRIPVILVVVDVKSRFVYWTKLQGVPAVREAYKKAAAAEQKTMTVRLPIANVLPATFDQLLKAVDQTASWLIVQQVCEAGSTSLLDAAVAAVRVGDAGMAINVQHDLFRSKEIDDLIGARQYEEAHKRALAIFQSTAERTEMRLAAGWNVVRLYAAILLARGETDQQRLTNERLLAVTNKMLQITMTKGTDRSLRLFAAFLHRNARLKAWVQKDLGLFMSSEAQRANQVFTFGMMHAARMPTANAVVTQLRRTQRLFLGILRNSSMYLVPQAWMEMVSSTIPFLTRLRFEKLNAAANSLIHWFDETGRLAIDTALRLRNWGEATGCALQVLTLSMGEEQGFDARVADATEAINRILDPEVRQRGLKQLDEYAAELRAASTRTADINDEPEMIRQMAAAMGIDLSDETDGIARVVNIGIRDLNPERALKDCRYLFVQAGPSGIPAQMLALPTAGWKSIRCTKFGYGAGALELDSAYDVLKSRHCDSCLACQPHPPGWKWTPEWQEQQHREHYQPPDEEGLWS